jgi:chromosome segregation ATPase
MLKFSELVTLLSSFNPLNATEPVWKDLLESEPLLSKLSVMEKDQIIPLLQKSLSLVTDAKRKKQLQHLLSIVATTTNDDIDYASVFKQRSFIDQINAITALQAQTEKEKARLTGDIAHEEGKLKQLTKGTDVYINTLLKQLQLYKDQLQMEEKDGATLRTHIQNLQLDIDKQDKDIRALHEKKIKYDERLREIEQEFKKNAAQRDTTPYEQQLQRRIAQLEQNLFETTELLKKSNVDAQQVNAIIGVEHISVAQLKVIIDELREELKRSESVSENWKKQYQEVQQKLASLHLNKLDQTQSANKALQETVRLTKKEADEVRNMYMARVSAHNQLNDNFIKLQAELEQVQAAQESTLIKLRQQLEQATAESNYHRERFERMQANETERNNHIRVALEAEFRTRHEAETTKLAHEMQRLREESLKNNEAIRIHKQLLQSKEMDIQNTKNAMNAQRQLDSQNIGQLTARIHKLEQEIIAAKRNLELQQDAFKEKEARLKAVDAQSKYHDAIIRSITEKADAKVASYEKQAAEANAQAQRMNMASQQANAQLIEYRNKLQQLQSNLLVSAKTGVDCDKKIADLEKRAKSDLEHANTKLKGVQTEYNELRRKITESEFAHKHAGRITEELTAERAKVAKNITEIKELKNKITELEVSKNQAVSEKTSIQALLKQCSVTQKQALNTQNQIDEQIQEVTKRHMEEKDKLDQLLHQQSQAIAKQEATIKDLQDKVSELTNSLREANATQLRNKAECSAELKRQVQAKEAAVRALLDMQRN